MISPLVLHSLDDGRQNATHVKILDAIALSDEQMQGDSAKQSMEQAREQERSSM